MSERGVTERELLERVARGDGEAGRELVERYRGLIASAARRILYTPADIDDVVQETFVVLLVHSGQIRDAERLGPWLWTTASNLARRTARRNSRQRPTDDAQLHVDVQRRREVECGPGEDFDRTLVRDEGCNALRKALTSISSDERHLIGLLTVEDRPSYAAISAATHRPVGSLGPTRQRILTKLRDHPAMARIVTAA